VSRTAGPSLRLSMIGTRGVPASYGGFETAVDEIGARLADRGHEVTVYCRGEATVDEHRGMHLVHLPAARRRSLETLTHTALSTVHAVAHRRPDAAFVFNAANSPFVPLLRARGIPTAVHVDGLEWRRAKWGRGGKAWYRGAESFAVRTASALIADAPGIAAYYEAEFRARTELISYGAPVQSSPSSDRLGELGLASDGYHLVVARFEPENHVLEIVRGYRASGAELPLVVVGSAPYAEHYSRTVTEAAGGDPRIQLLGGVWDAELLDQLYAGALTYLHGHSVGGTNPSLLRAMGAGTQVAAYDVGFNRQVAGPTAWYFEGPWGVALAVEQAERDAVDARRRGSALRDRAAELYDWDEVADSYERLARRLASGEVPNSGRRTRRQGTWTPEGPDGTALDADVRPGLADARPTAPTPAGEAAHRA